MDGLEKLPITLIMIVRNSGDKLEKVVNAHLDVVSEVVIIDQDSTDGTFEVAKRIADFAVQRRCKGMADPDRNWAYEIGTQPWILYLDDDEFLSNESKALIPDILKAGVDCVWMKRKNFIDGVWMTFMGDDVQCRLFKRGTLRWPDKAHTYPEKANNAVALYSDMVINHIRSFEQIIATHNHRIKALDAKSIELEKSFIEQVTEVLKVAKK